MTDCYFCKSIQANEGLDLVPELETDLFVASWDINPATPGHMLIIPKRHAQFMRDLSDSERQNLLDVVIEAKEYIKTADLPAVYQTMVRKVAGAKSEAFVNSALHKSQNTARPPEAFNDGLNDGPAAGQTIPHFHWHILPRWEGDSPDHQGGIRHMFSGMGNYRTGLSGNLSD